MRGKADDSTSLSLLLDERGAKWTCAVALSVHLCIFNGLPTPN